MADRILKFKQALRSKQTKKRDDDDEGFISKERKSYKGGRAQKTPPSKGSPASDKENGISKGNETNRKETKNYRRGNEKGNILEDILQASHRLTVQKNTLRKDKPLTGKEIKPTTKKSATESNNTKDIWVEDEVVSTVGIFNMGKSSRLIQRKADPRSKKENQVTKNGALPAKAREGPIPIPKDPKPSTKQLNGAQRATPDTTNTNSGPALNVFKSIRDEIQKIVEVGFTKEKNPKIQAIENLLVLSTFEETSKKSTDQAAVNCELLGQISKLSESVESLTQRIQVRKQPRDNCIPPASMFASPPRKKIRVSPSSLSLEEPTQYHSPSQFTPLPKSFFVTSASGSDPPPTPYRTPARTSRRLQPPDFLTPRSTTSPFTPPSLFSNEANDGSFYDSASPFTFSPPRKTVRKLSPQHNLVLF